MFDDENRRDMADDHAKNLLQPKSAGRTLPQTWCSRQMFAKVPNTQRHILTRMVWLRPKEQ